MLDWDDDIDDDLASLFGEEPDPPPAIHAREVPGPSGADLTARALAREAGQRLWDTYCRRVQQQRKR